MKKLKSLTPLFCAFLVSFLLTFCTAYFSNDFDYMSVMMYGMGYFFWVFAFFKIINLNRFVEAFSRYDIIAKKTKKYAVLNPFIEIILGAMYMFSFAGIYRDVITFIVMAISSTSIYMSIKRKDDIPCACMGMVYHVPMTKISLIESLLMALMAFYMIIAYFFTNPMIMLM